MHLGANPVAGVLTDDPVITVVGLQGGLYSSGDVTDASTGRDLGNATADKVRASSLTSPTRTVRAASPCHPSTMAP